MKTRVSKAYRGKEHIGWKKTFGGREWFLGYGTRPADETKAIALAEVLEAKWMLIRAGGGTELSQTDFEHAKAMLAGQPRWASARQGPISEMAVEHVPTPVPFTPSGPPSLSASQPATNPVLEQGPRRWLYASVGEFVSTTRKALKPDGSNGDHVSNTCERIIRACDAIEDFPLDLLRRKELDDWLLNIQALTSKLTGKALGPVQVVSRSAMTADVQASFTKAINVLLAELVRSLDRHNEGEGHGIIEEQMGRPRRNSCRPAEQRQGRDRVNGGTTRLHVEGV